MHVLNVGGDFEKVSVVVLYDSTSGEIVHVHQSVTHRGGRHPEENEIERQAGELVARRSPRVDLKKTSFLHVDPQLLQKEVEYKVDPATRKLVEKPAPRPAPRQQ